MVLRARCSEPAPLRTTPATAKVRIKNRLRNMLSPQSIKGLSLDESVIFCEILLIHLSFADGQSV